jgi:hypothetical protein
VDLFVKAIEALMLDEPKRKDLSIKAIQYIKDYHSVEDFVGNLRNTIRSELGK